MPTINKFTSKLSKQFITATLIYALCFALPLTAFAGEDANPQFENLARVDDSGVAVAYVDPEADFSVFDSVMILDTYVAFRSGWARDQRRGTRGSRISSTDMERIKARVSELFNSVLIDVMEANEGFKVVNEPDYNVLLIRAAIIDLDVTVPDTRQAGRSSTFTADSGSATLYIELFDSVSGQIIGRAIDRQSARNRSSVMTWTNRATNTADARRIFRKWATQLRGFLDSHYSGE